MEVWMLTDVTTPKQSKNVAPTLGSRDYKSPPLVVCIEGNGTRPSHMGVGMSIDSPMYTLNTTEVHAVMLEESNGNPVHTDRQTE